MFGVFLVGTYQMILDGSTGRYQMYDSERQAWAAILSSPNSDQYCVREVKVTRK